MASFDEREKGYERKFEHDQEFAFKVRARRDKFLGLWAAERLGLVGAAAEAYAKEVVDADLQHPGDDDVTGKIAGDFAARGIALDPTRLRFELERCATEARRQLQAAR